MKSLKIYRNEDIVRIVAFIPPGHYHVRLLIETKDQIIVFQEATVAGIVRAYIDVVTHPIRKAIELKSTLIEKRVRKHGYAEYQLIESNRSEEEVLKEIEDIIKY